MSKKYKKEVVHEICFHLLPENVKEDVFHAAFTVYAAWENSESLADLDEPMGDLALALTPAWQDAYGLKVERLVEDVEAA